jgi:hypothetical protein
METYNAAGFPFVAGAESESSDSANEDELRMSDFEDSDYLDMSLGKHKRSSVRSGSRNLKKPPPPPLQKATVLLLAKPEQQNDREAGETEKKIMARIMKCRDRGSSKSTPEAEAQTALAMAARLMEQHNISMSEVLQQSSEPKTWEQGESHVRITRTRGTSMQVAIESWTLDVARAVKILFDVESYTISHHDRHSKDRVFCGIAQNTMMAAQAFEVVYNLIHEWARGKVGSKNNYCRGVAHGFVKIARETKAEEEKAAIETARVERLAREAKEHLDRQRLLSRLKDQPATTSEETMPEDTDMKSEEKADFKVKMEEIDENGSNNQEGTQPMEETTEAPDDGNPGSSNWLNTGADQSYDIAENTYIVERLLRDKTAHGVEYILVKWHVYDETNWERRDTLLEDVPDIVAAYERRKGRTGQGDHDEDDASVLSGFGFGANDWSDDGSSGQESDDETSADACIEKSQGRGDGIEASDNNTALTQYRLEAGGIAKEMLSSMKLKKSRHRYVGIRDRIAYEQGKRDARDIDIKRKRIEDGASAQEGIQIGAKRRRKD